MTKEFLYYEIALNIDKCKPLKEIDLMTYVRVPIIYELTLYNPINRTVTFKPNLGLRQLKASNELQVNPYTERSLSFEYKPLFPEKSSMVINISCDELGDFPYKFILTAKAAAMEKPIIMKANFGQSSVQIVPLKNVADETANFHAIVS